MGPPKPLIETMLITFFDFVEITASLLAPFFQWLRPRICDAPSCPVAPASFWPFSSKTNEYDDEAADNCVVRMTLVLFAIFVVVAVLCFRLQQFLSSLAKRLGWNTETRGTNTSTRGTNTPPPIETTAVETATDPEAETVNGATVERTDSGISNDADEDALNRMNVLLRSLTGAARDVGFAVGDKESRIEELSFENRALRQCLDDEEQLMNCVVCKSERRNVILFPCRHLCLCETCACHNFVECPYCRTRCTKQEKIFL